MTTTVKQILRAINDDNLSLYKGEGYWYFVYDDEPNNVWADHSVYCYRLNHLEMSKWIDIGRDFVNQVKATK